MAERIEFELVSPEQLLISEPVEMVVVPCTEGDIGVLPGHSPLLAIVRPGVIDIHEGGKVKDSIFVGGGFCEVNPERCTVLVEEALPISSIDRGEAEKRLTDAKAAFEAATDAAAKKAAETEIKTAEAMLQASAKQLH
ncbi:MAG: ATP synthase F1 subunit epsilon [Rhodospirillales bacterium]|nr:ATP synthase F1 subunit epsilon [Rhodospirillales bacterium]